MNILVVSSAARLLALTLQTEKDGAGNELKKAAIGQTLEGSFSAESKPHFASKYAFESSRRDLHNALLKNFSNYSNILRLENGAKECIV